MTSPRPSIKLRQLQYFLEVAKRLHFSQAAEALFVTQPTLSHQISELEKQIGVPLFDRAGHKVRLTEAGGMFQVYASRALAEVEAGRNALAELEGLERGVLRIGVSQSFVRKLLPPILRQFSSRHPGVRQMVDELTASQIERKLVAGELDIGIAFAPSVMEETELEPLIEERLMLVVAPGNQFEGKSRVPMAALSGQPLAMFNRTYSTRGLIDGYLAEAQATPDVVCETNSINLLLARVEGCVMSIIPESAFEPATGLIALPLVEPTPVRVSALLWSRHNFRTKAARFFAQSAREHFAAMLPASGNTAGQGARNTNRKA